MKPFATILSLLALTAAAMAQSGGAPPPGEYKGVVRIVSHDQFSSQPARRWMLRTTASVSEAGEVTINVSLPSAPIPTAPYAAAPASLPFYPDEDGAFTFGGPPRLPPAEVPQANETSPGSTSMRFPWEGRVLISPLDQPVFTGRLQFNGSTFRVTYANLPLYVSYVIAPPTTTYTYVFRRVPTATVK